jgi:hypothetical protein
VCLHRGQCAQGPHLVEKARLQHRVESRLDAGVQHRAIGRRQRELEHLHRQAVGRVHALPFGNRAAARAMDLQRALDALRVGRVDARGGDRIDFGQSRVQRGPAIAFGFGGDLRAQGGIGFRHRCEAVQKRLEIQAGASGEDREFPAREDVVDGDAGVAREVGRGIRLPRITDIDQVMRDVALLFARRFRRTDVEPSYTNAESTLTISPPYRAAQASANAVLPDAVGPAIASARGRTSAPAAPARRSVPMLRQRRMHLVVRLAHRTHRHAVEQAGDHDRARCREEPGHHFVQLLP